MITTSSELAAFLQPMYDRARPVHVFELHGMSLFPIYGLDGAMRAASAIFLILRGDKDVMPTYEGPFPYDDGEWIKLGRGWIVMCVHVNAFDPIEKNRVKIEAAEKRLKEGRLT